jgi:hypothetical protein
VGGALLASLHQLATEQGYRVLSLSVGRRNRAQRLYTRQGFHNAGLSTPTETSVTLVAALDDTGIEADRVPATTQSQ